MFSRKSKPVPPAPRHWFRMKVVGTEFEGQGLGLIVAFFALVVVALVLLVGGSAATAVGGNIWGRILQQEPETPVRPPPA